MVFLWKNVQNGDEHVRRALQGRAARWVCKGFLCGWRLLDRSWTERIYALRAVRTM